MQRAEGLEGMGSQWLKDVIPYNVRDNRARDPPHCGLDTAAAGPTHCCLGTAELACWPVQGLQAQAKEHVSGPCDCSA